MPCYYVYTHTRLDTREVFYVGKGTGKRAWEKRGRNVRWRRIANKAGYEVSVVENGLAEWYAFEREKDYIILHSATVCNMTDGGEGTSGCVPSEEARRNMSIASTGRLHSEEAKKKMSEYAKSRTYSEETRKKLSDAAKRKVVSQETREKLRIASTGQRHSAEVRARISAVQIGKVIPEEQRKKISESHRGKKMPASAVAKTAAAHRGMKRSEEARRNMSLAQQRRLAERKLFET